MTTGPTVSFALVLRGLEQYRDFIHGMAASPLVASVDFSFGAPIYKGSDAIKAGVAAANSALEKFDVYFAHALLDEQERVRFSRLFAQGYLRRFPASERTDLFLASAEVMKVTFELVQPVSVADLPGALAAIEEGPHDLSVLTAIRRNEAIDRAHLRFEVRVFLDHVMNPRRREQPAVQQAMQELGTDLPYILELVSNGAIPGYVWYAAGTHIEDVGGRLVFLPCG